MLIPQSLSYAKIATIPVEYGLMSSWLPPTLYAIMGSTKGGQDAIIHGDSTR
jgi:sodium-independent sulfate anion transporter 11